MRRSRMRRLVQRGGVPGLLLVSAILAIRWLLRPIRILTLAALTAFIPGSRDESPAS